MTTQAGSAKCNFCGRIFKNKQAVKAHLKGCIAYREHVPRQRVREAMPEAMNGSLPQVSRERMEAENRNRRKEIILEVIKEVVVHHWRFRDDIPQEVKMQATQEIRRELSTLPVEETPFSELREIAEGIRNQICEPEIQAQDAVKQQKAADEEARRRQKENLYGALERMEKEIRKKQQREALVAHAVRYAEQRLKTAPGVEIWHQWSAMNAINGAIAREVIGTESKRDIDKLVDELLLPFLEEGAHRVAETRKVKLVEFAKKYAQEELDEEEDLDPFEQAMICEKVRQALGKKLRGDETKEQVEYLVEDLLDDEFM